MQNTVIRTSILMMTFVLIGYIYGEDINTKIIQKYHVFLGTSIPLGDFASHGESYRNCYADYGFAFGIEGAYYLREEARMGMLLNVSFIINPFENTRLINALNAIPEDPTMSDVKWDAMERYLNIPIMGGFIARLYTTETKVNVRIFAQGGLNILRLAPYWVKLTFTEGNEDYVMKGKFRGVSFGYGAGATFTFINRVSITGRYLNLGEPEDDPRMVIRNESYSARYTEEMGELVSFPVSVVTVTVGIDF